MENNDLDYIPLLTQLSLVKVDLEENNLDENMKLSRLEL